MNCDVPLAKVELRRPLNPPGRNLAWSILQTLLSVSPPSAMRGRRAKFRWTVGEEIA